MKLKTLIDELVATMAEHGNVEVELQERSTNCDSCVYVVPERFRVDGSDQTIVKLRAWFA